MKKIYSKVDPMQLLHIVNRLEEIGNRVDLIPPEQFLQTSVLKNQSGKIFKPHYHLVKALKEKETIAQESWVVIKGSVKVDYYDIDQSFIGSAIIRPGDCTITLAGGHGYEILENDTIIYEFKTGPYYGQMIDKIYID